LALGLIRNTVRNRRVAAEVPVISVSVCIVALDEEQALPALFRSLDAQSVKDFELVLVNDRSTDETGALMQAYAARAPFPAKVVHNTTAPQGTTGKIQALDIAIEASSGELLLFTDADCAPAPYWVAQMTAPFADPEVAGVKGVYQTRQPQLVARFVQFEYETRYARMARAASIDFVDTYSAAYRREVFLANGGFDPVFPTASVEDQEFSFRLARKGYRLCFAPEAAVYHRHDRTLGEYWRRKFAIGYWKALLLRWHPERAIRDSHTPQVLKAQIGLAALLITASLTGLFWPPAGWVALSAALLFGLSGAPFCWRAMRRDLALGLAAFWLLLVRALALGSGLAVGTLRFLRQPGTRRAPIGGLNRALKRVLDVVGSLVGILLAAPLLPVVAAAIKLDSPGPVFFSQERVGEKGVPFRCLKLRTMVEGAQDMLPSLVDLEGLPAPAFKLQDDPRVTRVGRFLRRTSIDELPQLWNVLKGEMSLVGPRPEEVQVVRLYNDWHRRRLAVKPGITGPMQVGGRADLDLDQRIRLELEYIDHYSLWRDLGLLARTVAAVVSGRGAY